MDSLERGLFQDNRGTPWLQGVFTPRPPQNSRWECQCSVTSVAGSAVSLAVPRPVLQGQACQHPSSCLPMALERLRPPFTLPSMVTLPPAFFILASSTSSSGLWSYDMSTALPPSDTTQRESPALATISCLPRMSATTAVVPLSEPGCKKTEFW